jgi:hypothetical protein
MIYYLNSFQKSPPERIIITHAEIKNANRSAENENCNLKQKIVHYDRKLRFPSEIPSTLRVKICLIQSKECDVNDDHFSKMQLTCHVK